MKQVPKLHTTLIASTCLFMIAVCAEEAPASLTARGTRHVCDFVGLGAYESVPVNFPGANANLTQNMRGSGLVLPEESLPAGSHSDVPAVFGGDLGLPFEGGDGRMYFTFGDTRFPSPALSCEQGEPVCWQPLRNDDLFASAAFSAAARTCPQLSIDRALSTNAPQPMTLVDSVAGPGHDLGPAVVPGPGFSTGRYIFMLTPDAAQSCSVANQNCVDVGGQTGDVCVPEGPEGRGVCRFGECENRPDSPCALRLETGRLAVRQQKSVFVTPTVGVHVTSPGVANVYRGHFSTVTFYAEVDELLHNGVVWVIGRDSYWGTPRLTMSPYLMFHPVVDGMLGEPSYFAGYEGDKPRFSSNSEDAQPVYQESKPINHHTSLGFVEQLGGGVWLLLYGGHAQPVLKASVERFVKPAPDSLFYDREAGIYVRWAKNPWGPWSEPTTVYNPYVRGQGGYCEEMYFEDLTGAVDFDCPAELTARNASLNRLQGGGMGGEYGAAWIPGSASVIEGGAGVEVHWLLSTWNPYRVIMISSVLELTGRVLP